MAQNEQVVEYSLEGEDIHYLAMNSPFLPDLKIDYTDVHPKQRAGTATRLLCAAGLYCFGSTLAGCLIGRKVKINSLKGRAVPEMGRDDNFRMRVTRCRIDITVDVDEADQPLLEKCAKLMMKGCLVTYSMHEGIEMEYRVLRPGSDEPVAQKIASADTTV